MLIRNFLKFGGNIKSETQSGLYRNAQEGVSILATEENFKEVHNKKEFQRNAQEGVSENAQEGD